MRPISALALLLLLGICIVPATAIAQEAPPVNVPSFVGAGDGDSEPLAPGDWHEFDAGGGHNIIIVQNNVDDRFQARGNAELDRVHGNTVEPVNVAEAHAQCTGCQTIAVALQVVLYQSGAPTIAPVNRAVALNTTCSGCMTIARAIQYVIPVDDLDNVPHELNVFIARVDQETDYLQHVRDLNQGNVSDVQAHMDQMEADFASLQQYVMDMADVQQGTDTLTPTPSVMPAGASAATAMPTSASATSTAMPTSASATSTAMPTSATATSTDAVPAQSTPVSP